MDTRTDLQRLLEDMDKMIQRKQEELAELDERLETARVTLSNREAQELLAERDADGQQEGAAGGGGEQRQEEIGEYLGAQRAYYEQQIGRLNEELGELESANEQLARLNDQLRGECRASQLAGEQLQAKLAMMRENVEELKSANFELNILLAKAESELQLRQKLLEKSHEQDQVLMEAFNKKLDSLKRTIAARDDEIRRLRLDNEYTLQSLGIRIELSNGDNISEEEDGNSEHELGDKSIARVDEGRRFHAQTSGGLIDSRNKQRIIRIASLIRDKDNQIEMLKQQLVEMTRELESNTSLLQKLTQSDRPRAEQHEEGDEPLGAEVVALKSRCQMLELELEVKDEQLNRMGWRQRELESHLPSEIVDLLARLKCALAPADEQQAHHLDPNVTPIVSKLISQLGELLHGLEGSRDLLDRIEEMQQLIGNKDGQIRRLVEELNELGAGVQRDPLELRADEQQQQQQAQAARPAADEERPDVADTFASVTSVPDEPEPASETLDGRQDGQRSIEQAMEATNCQTAHSADGRGRTDDRHEVRCSKSPSSGRKRNLALVSKRPSGAHLSTSKFLRNLFSAKRRHKLARQAQADTSGGSGMNSDSNSAGIDVKRALELRTRLRQLEHENQLLELGMKEILLAIRWADTRCSTLLIDCPSLERLCQLTEARFVAGERAERCQEVASTTVAGGQLDGTAASGELFQFVVLKSELDLLRGQNEQLRSELKLQRRELHARLVAEAGQQRAELNEVEVQTEGSLELAIQGVARQPDEHQEESSGLTSEPADRCRKCSSLIRLANHLIECIGRIELRVNTSDETNINRLTTLNRLIEHLGRDLAHRETQMRRRQHDFHLVSKQKLLAETKLRFLEDQLEVHAKLCPLVQGRQGRERIAQPTNQPPATYYVQGNKLVDEATLVGEPCRQKWASGARSTMAKERAGHSGRNNKITISLLQSIISCLQARLDYKDERISQLEQTMTGDAYE